MFLVLTSDPETMLRVRRLLFSAGILTIPGTYHYAIQNPREDKIDAVILPDPFDPEKPPRFCQSYKNKHPSIPIAVFAPPLREPTRDMGFADCILNSDQAPAALVHSMLVGLTLSTGRDFALRMASEARDHLLQAQPSWGATPLPLTPTERAIYRYLIMKYPATATARELLRYCTKPGTAPTLCNVPSHIYRINLKAEETVGRHIIECPDKVGYKLLL